MNDLEKAKLLIENKNNSLVDISRKYNIPVQTLRNLRHDPSKMKKASWERVHLLAQIYDEQLAEKKINAP